MSVSAPSSVTNTSPCWNGLIVPGSTLMYGSSLMLVTLMPRDSRIAAREAEAIPFPREETTPPVTKTYLVISESGDGITDVTAKKEGAQRNSMDLDRCPDAQRPTRGQMRVDPVRIPHGEPVLIEAI